MLCNCYLPCRFCNPIRQSLLTYDDKQGRLLYSYRMFLASSLHLPSSGLMLSEGVTDWEGRIISREGRGTLRHCFSNKGANKEGVTLALGTTTSHLSCSNTTSKILHCLPVTNYCPLTPPLRQLQSTHSARVNF